MAKKKGTGNSKRIPAGCTPVSMVRQVMALRVGQSCTRVIDIADDVTLGEIKENMTAWRKRALANTQSSIAYAKKRMGEEADDRVFSLETSCHLSNSYTLSIIVTVRRSEDYVDL